MRKEAKAKQLEKPDAAVHNHNSIRMELLYSNENKGCSLFRNGG